MCKCYLSPKSCILIVILGCIYRTTINKASMYESANKASLVEEKALPLQPSNKKTQKSHEDEVFDAIKVWPIIQVNESF